MLKWHKLTEKEWGMPLESFALAFADHTEYFSDKLFLNREIANNEVLKWLTFVDGLRSYVQCPVGTWEFLEEQHWVAVEDEEWPFSFLSLCRHFHIDAESLRNRLLKSKS